MLHLLPSLSHCSLIGRLCCCRATLERYAELGLKHPEQKMPGHGMLAAAVPGAFDAWMLLLATEGTMRPREVLGPMIRYCHDGCPISQVSPPFQQARSPYSSNSYG